jgi:hypothetical protein
LRLDPAQSHQRADRWGEAADPRADVVALRLHSSFTRAVDVVHPLVGPLEQARDGGGGHSGGSCPLAAVLRNGIA